MVAFCRLRTGCIVRGVRTDGLVEFVGVFRRNGAVVLRSNVRVMGRTSGTDCHFPLPFQIAQVFRAREDTESCVKFPRLLHADAGSLGGAIVPTKRNGWRNPDHRQSRLGRWCFEPRASGARRRAHGLTTPSVRSARGTRDVRHIHSLSDRTPTQEGQLTQQLRKQALKGSMT